jgi:hypothetical protein
MTNNSEYNYSIQSLHIHVLARVYRDGEEVKSELFGFGTLEYKLKKATKWANNCVNLLKKYEGVEKL